MLYRVKDGWESTYRGHPIRFLACADRGSLFVFYEVEGKWVRANEWNGVGGSWNMLSGARHATPLEFLLLTGFDYKEPTCYTR